MNTKRLEIVLRKWRLCRSSLLALAAAAVVLPSAPASAGVFTGLEGYWSFNGTAADQSGNGNNLSLFGGASFASGGQFGQALSLNGAQGSYAQQTSNNAAFNFGSKDFTVQVWAKLTPGQTQTLIEKFSGDSGPGWTLSYVSGVEQFYQGSPYNSSAINVSAGVWQQFVAERNGNSLDIYYDGSLVGRQAISGAISPSSNPLLIGARNAADTRNFTVNGLIDDVGIWDRALSPTEIGSLCNNGNGLAFQSSVPKPSTWAMMLLGFAGVGFMAYWRKSKPAFMAT